MTSPLSPEAVAQMVADRGAGTPGPWREAQTWRPPIGNGPHSDMVNGNIFWGYSISGSNENGGHIYPTLAAVHNFPDHVHANASRIARLPDLEAAYLTLAAENATLRAERDATMAALERDRTTVAETINAVKSEIASREWLIEGRGPYEWDDDRYRSEFSDAVSAIRGPIEKLGGIARDWSNCPTDPAKISAARIDCNAELATLRASEAAALERVTVLEAASAHVLHDIDDLVANSEGVTGLHRNGDVAEWSDILEGGSFEVWLRSVETLRAALTPTADKEPKT